MTNNASAGTFISNQTLVVQSVSRHSSGAYTCVASNAEGNSHSRPFVLSVKCKTLLYCTTLVITLVSLTHFDVYRDGFVQTSRSVERNSKECTAQLARSRCSSTAKWTQTRRLVGSAGCSTTPPPSPEKWRVSSAREDAASRPTFPCRKRTTERCCVGLGTSSDRRQCRACFTSYLQVLLLYSYTSNKQSLIDKEHNTFYIWITYDHDI